MDSPEWAIITYETIRGEKPVDEFIQKQQPQARAKIIHGVRLLKVYGNRLGMPHAKILDGKLYELRIRGKEELRIFYCFMKKKIYLLHGFKKQTIKTPSKELEIALQRKQHILLTKI